MLLFHLVGLPSLRRLQPIATEAVPSVALVASSVAAVVPEMAIAFPALVVVSAATSTLIEMPHTAHPIGLVFFNFVFLPNDVDADGVSSFTVFNLIPDRDGASCALFDSFDCCTTPSSTKLCQITLAERNECAVVCFHFSESSSVP